MAFAAGVLAMLGGTALAAGAPSAHGAVRRSLRAVYMVKLGLSGQASHDQHDPCDVNTNPCSNAYDMVGRASFHIDLAYVGVALNPRNRYDGGGANSKHLAVVNGSFTETGDWDPNDNGGSVPFSCAGSLRAANGLLPGTVTWNRHGSKYSFSMTPLGASGPVGGPGVDSADHGGVCKSPWFAQVPLSNGGPFIASFSIPVRDIGRKTITKVLGGPVRQYRPMPSDYGCSFAQGASCENSFAWNAVVKFTLKSRVG